MYHQKLSTSMYKPICSLLIIATYIRIHLFIFIHAKTQQTIMINLSIVRIKQFLSVCRKCASSTSI